MRALFKIYEGSKYESRSRIDVRGINLCLVCRKLFEMLKNEPYPKFGSDKKIMES